MEIKERTASVLWSFNKYIYLVKKLHYTVACAPFPLEMNDKIPNQVILNYLLIKIHDNLQSWERETGEEFSSLISKTSLFSLVGFSLIL